MRRRVEKGDVFGWTTSYPGYKKKQVRNEPTEAYFFLIKQVSKRIKIKKHVWIITKRVKLKVNKTIGHVNQTTQYGISLMHEKELEIINITITCDKEANKHKETSSTYGNKGEEKTFRTSERK